MLPILLCSIGAVVIIIERFVRLSLSKIFPQDLRQQLINMLFDQGNVNRSQLQRIKKESPLGDVLATGLLYREYGLESMTMHMQNRASVQIHALEKNINMLGTIGAISPLLGLLGTVLGIISSFLAITEGAMKDPTLLAAGVSQALITTAAGMFVAIPALMAYRFYQRRIVDINAQMEQEAGLLIQELYDHDLMVETPHGQTVQAAQLDQSASAQQHHAQGKPRVKVSSEVVSSSTQARVEATDDVSQRR